MMTYDVEHEVSLAKLKSLANSSSNAKPAVFVLIKCFNVFLMSNILYSNAFIRF